MCTVPLPPGVNPVAVDKYVNIYIKIKKVVISRIKKAMSVVEPTDIISSPACPTTHQSELHVGLSNCMCSCSSDMPGMNVILTGRLLLTT
jgi:hypothetical protein